MKLIDILNGIEYELLNGNIDIEIKGIEQDSRKIKKDYLFFAIKGYNSDGHDYINQAIENGAIAIIVTDDIKIDSNITIIKVKDDKDAMAYISSKFYNNPSEKLDLIGVTGTNGKTSITYILKTILEEKNKKIGIIGTMGSVIDNKLIDNANTTPESIEIQKQINNMIEVNTDCCIMEVSSHSLNEKVKRVAYLDFNIAVFTNLTEDHLDFHPTMEDYFNDKKKLFNMTKNLNVVNYDSSYGKRLIEELKSTNVELLTYGFDNNADIFATDIVLSNKGSKFLLNTPKGSIDISMRLLGKFSISNTLAAIAIGLYYGFELDEIKSAVEKVNGIKGRFENIPLDEEYSVIIDFAHTPDGLEQVLNTIKEFTVGKIITVFGAGGNRDKKKRPIMGETVARLSDIPVVTSDNPRFEKPEEIIEDIIVGVEKYNKNYVNITDRKEAIKYALKIAEKGDTILLAGKGHETYLLLNGETFPFDEKEIVLDILAKMKGEN